MADVKLETDIVEKRRFAVKKKTTYYTFSVVNFFLQRTLCLVNRRFMLCKFLGSWQKQGPCYLTRQLLFGNKFNVSDFSTLSFLFRLVMRLKHSSSYRGKITEK